MREIGSEFWDVPVKSKNNGLFPKFTQWFLSGRSALQAVIKNLNHCHTVSIPSWCCDSMIKPFVDAGMCIHYYPVYYDGELTQEVDFDSDILLLIDYFGYTTPSRSELSDFKGVVIRDVTHSIFSTTYSDADYYFGSLRKWCGIWTGGFAWCRNRQKLPVEVSDDYGYIALRQGAMLQKSEYINKARTDKNYLKIFDEAEERLENIGIVPAAVRDVSLAEQLDIENIRSRRKSNAKVLQTAFHDWLVFRKRIETDCPMFVPILVPDGKRDGLKRYLIKKGIYCPIHWPVGKYHRLDERTEYIYKNELSLVCDQRYTEEDMERIVKAIQLFMEGKE